MYFLFTFPVVISSRPTPSTSTSECLKALSPEWFPCFVTLRAEAIHFRCMSWGAKSNLCRRPFKSVKKSGRINKKTVFFLFLTGLEHCVSLTWVLRSRSDLSQFFPRHSRHLTTGLTINFACESRDKFRACMIENWTVVGRGYFSHSSSQSENVASACRVMFYCRCCFILFCFVFVFLFRFVSFILLLFIIIIIFIYLFIYLFITLLLKACDWHYPDLRLVTVVNILESHDHSCKHIRG